jgi:hypothetical protein
MAARVDISHLGVHTHANLVLFQLSLQEAAILQGSSHVRVVAHCRLPTNKASMPPGFQWLAHDYGAIPTYGPIDGSPGWSVSDVFAKNGKKFVKVSVPSRFANWVASQPSALRLRYQNRRNYSLEIRWE